MAENSKNIVSVTEENFSEVVEKSQLPVLLAVGATWCVDCRRVRPLFIKFADEYAGKILFASVDVDESPNLKANLGVKHIPTFFYFKNGKQEAVLIEPKTIATFKDFVEQTLS